MSRTTTATLNALPFRIDLRPLGGHGSGATVTLLHGNQVLNTVYVHEDRSDAFLRRMGSGVAAKSGDVVCFGHTHRPWYRVVDGVHYVNTGSVGRPKDGDWRAGYVVLDVAPGRVAVEIARIEYDVEAAMRGIRDSTLPVEFAEYLRTGGGTGTPPVPGVPPGGAR